MTLLLTVAGQLMLKLGVQRRGELPGDVSGAVAFLGRALVDPLVVGALFLAFLGALSWIGALSKLDLAVAYPFMSLAFVLTTLLSNVWFKESVGRGQWLGISLVAVGLVFVARG